MTLSTADPAIASTGCANADSPVQVHGVVRQQRVDDRLDVRLDPEAQRHDGENGHGQSVRACDHRGGHYTISLKATKSDLREDRRASRSPRAASLCSPLPPTQNVSITKVGCTSGCAPGTKVTFWPVFQGYSAQSCDTFCLELRLR